MGPEKNSQEPKVFMIADEQPVEMKAEIAEITFSEQNVPFNAAPISWSGCEFSMRIRRPRHMRCTNRKRFVKLLMGAGVQQSMAKRTARLVQMLNSANMPAAYRTSYQEAFDDILLRWMF